MFAHDCSITQGHFEKKWTSDNHRTSSENTVLEFTFLTELNTTSAEINGLAF